MFHIFRSKASRLRIFYDRLEKEKQKLISALKNNGMEFLVTTMASTAEYSELIKERRKIDLTYSSEDLISGYAYRHSETLHSAENKAELLQLLSNVRFSAYKKYICCCLASLCSNTNDKDLFHFLVDLVKNEEDERTRVSILSRLAPIKKDNSFNIEPIKYLAREGTADESRAAIMALSNSVDPEAEDIILTEFKIASTHLKGVICGPLSTVGTARSIPALKEAYKKTRDAGLRMLIEDAVNKIEDRAKSGH